MLAHLNRRIGKNVSVISLFYLGLYLYKCLRMKVHIMTIHIWLQPFFFN